VIFFEFEYYIMHNKCIAFVRSSQMIWQKITSKQKKDQMNGLFKML